METQTMENNDTSNHDVSSSILYLSIELSKNTWRLAFSDGQKVRLAPTIDARDWAAFNVQIEKAKQKFSMKNTHLYCCYEAGRDGFWIHRFLKEHGLDNIVVDSASIEVNRRKRRAKTDRLDAEKLVTMLVRYHNGETTVFSVVHVPTEQEEDDMRLHRELECLKKEQTKHTCRIKGLLFKHGIVVEKIHLDDWEASLRKISLWDGNPLPEDTVNELIREADRLKMVKSQIDTLLKRQKQKIKEAETKPLQMVVQLMRLKGIGMLSAWVFVMEFFGWRKFKNRRQIGSLAGLTGTPYDSGSSSRDIGISKAGNRRVRTLAIEISWLWLRYQPDSRLSKWYWKRFGYGGKRMRRIGIVAVARKLLIQLWQYLENGVVPEGVELK